jgi:hypothetical protein
MSSFGHKLLNETDKLFNETKDLKVLEESNEKMAKKAKELTMGTLKKVTMEASKVMKCGYSRADN